MTDSYTKSGLLHHELIDGLIERGSIPPREELMERLGCATSDELDRVFDELADEHGVVLHPSSHEVWAIHPFSLAPTLFLVESGEKTWWGNCAWCSLGITALVGGRCFITTTLGAEGEQVHFAVEDEQMDRSDLVVHFPIPMARAWDNVVYTCSTMLMFKDAAHVDEWCARRRIPRGDVQPVSKVLELARRWYGEHLRRDWRKKSITEARRIFDQLGFSHPVWSLPSNEQRF